MILQSGTFDYLVIVPQARSEAGFECRAETRGPAFPGMSIFTGPKLFGNLPQVRVTDAGAQSEPGLSPP